MRPVHSKYVHVNHVHLDLRQEVVPMVRTATTWGITGPQFLWGYAALCLSAAIGVWQQWRSALGPKERGNDPQPDLGPYKLAMLSGGPQLAITTAATKLHRDGVLKAGPYDGTLVVSGELEPGADRLERALFDTVKHDPCLTTATMRAELEDSEPVQWMKDELVDAGLLLDDSRSALLRRLWLVGGLLALLGIARIVAGALHHAAVGYLVVMVLVVVYATFRLGRHRPLATTRGREIVKRQRQERDDLRRHPVAGESVLTAALFGGGALWLADPAIASTLGVPREQERGWSHGGGGGGYGCSAGGGCGSGSSCGGGGGGCGGGGCGGGG
jgi:uncharacterized protein (TIGR04222 family)